MIGRTLSSPMLLSTPFPLLLPRPSLIRFSRHSHGPLHPLSLAVSGPHHLSPSFCSQPRHRLPTSGIGQVHTRSSVGAESGESSHRPWPEWLELVEHVTVGGFTGTHMPPPRGEDDDSFSVSEELPEGFAEAASACLLFARERPDLLSFLPKRDIKVVVENGSPFLFKNAFNSVRRMKAFISGDGSDDFQVLGSEQAVTVDMMRYLLSYVGDSVGAAGGDDTQCGELVETSVRSLLHELVKVDGTVQEPNVTDSVVGHTPFRYEQSHKPPRQKIEMKRGDWICPKCNFMNFAKNLKCVECSEARPKRQLTGVEWECPQCDFFNYGRNMACLRCDCKRPGEISALERSLGNAQYMHSSVNEDSVEGSDPLGGIESDKMSESAISRRLDKILGRTSATSGTKDTGTRSAVGEASIRARSRFTSPERGDSDYVPFVPLPADMFRKKPTEEQQVSAEENVNSEKTDQLTDTLPGGSGPVQSDGPSCSEDSNRLTVGKTNKESSDLSEILSRKAAWLPDDNNLASATPDDEFPEIMPMRKGENRFVVSKKKDRSLTSPQYKRRIAMEQANNSNFVPFVPFPPGYFARKDKQSEDGASVDKAAAGTSTSAVSGNDQSGPQKFEENKPAETMQGNAGNIGQVESPRTRGNGDSPTLEKNANNLWNKHAENFNRGYSRESTASESVSGSLYPQVEDLQNKSENGNSGFSRRSLEGSAVTEPDPLDMSEEAKAQRWFRRVAQINDISELSKIPDEDFPEIMPMRKGVNRFVVSKRKTPLERRLTSPQYRRSLPIVSSEPEKDSS